MNIAKGIRTAREYRKLSQRALSRAIDCDGSYLCSLEAGRVEPSLSILRAIGRELSVPVAALIAWSSTERERVDAALEVGREFEHRGGGK
jgi:transcriptional regulator with XRE-family HTH domain